MAIANELCDEFEDLLVESTTVADLSMCETTDLALYSQAVRRRTTLGSAQQQASAQSLVHSSHQRLLGGATLRESSHESPPSESISAPPVSAADPTRPIARSIAQSSNSSLLTAWLARPSFQSNHSLFRSNRTLFSPYVTSPQIAERDLMAVKRLKSDSGARWLLLLTPESFGTDVGARLAAKVALALHHGVQPIVIYEPSRYAFGAIVAATPTAVVSAGLYGPVAIEWHTGPFRNVSVRQIARALGAQLHSTPVVWMGQWVGETIASLEDMCRGAATTARVLVAATASGVERKVRGTPPHARTVDRQADTGVFQGGAEMMVPSEAP